MGTGGWFDAFRSSGGPTWYGDNRTPVVVDTRAAAIVLSFSLLYFAFIVILPGVRRERLSSFFAITTNFFVGAVLLVCIFYPAWIYGYVRILSPYRAFSIDYLDAYLGVKIGLSCINITLKGFPVQDSQNHMYYNENFDFTEVNSMPENLARSLSSGLPYPILTVLQHFTMDSGGLAFGRQYRIAGYYTGALLWFGVAIWLLTLLVMILVPSHYSRCLLALGVVQWIAALTYCLTAPRDLVIPFSSSTGEVEWLRFRLYWCFWLILSSGGLCVLFGFVLRFCELKNVYRFATFLQVDFDELYTSAAAFSGDASCIQHHGNSMQMQATSERKDIQRSSSALATPKFYDLTLLPYSKPAAKADDHTAVVVDHHHATSTNASQQKTSAATPRVNNVEHSSSVVRKLM